MRGRVCMYEYIQCDSTFLWMGAYFLLMCPVNLDLGYGTTTPSPEARPPGSSRSHAWEEKEPHYGLRRPLSPLLGVQPPDQLFPQAFPMLAKSPSPGLWCKSRIPHTPRCFLLFEVQRSYPRQRELGSNPSSDTQYPWDLWASVFSAVKWRYHDCLIGVPWGLNVRHTVGTQSVPVPGIASHDFSCDWPSESQGDAHLWRHKQEGNTPAPSSGYLRNGKVPLTGDFYAWFLNWQKPQ